MSRYQVFWPDEVLSDLALIWTNSLDRSAVTSAANTADRLLARAPSEIGFELSEGLRCVTIEPLHFLFVISEPDRRVEIAALNEMEDEWP